MAVADSISIPVLAGLTVGILLITSFGLLTTYAFPNYPKLHLHPGNQYPNWWMSSSWIGITKGLDETQTFLKHYPNAKTIVYHPVGIVEYYVHDNVTSKFASLRIIIAPDNNSITFAQATCVLVDTETQEAVNREGTRIELKGPPLAHIAEFLQDERCPK